MIFRVRESHTSFCVLDIQIIEERQLPTNFKAEKVLENLDILASLCLESRKDKLRAMDGRGLFRISKNATGLFGGWGRDKADSITGELGNQIVEFFEFAKQHSYNRPRLIQTVQINPADMGISYKASGKEVRLLGNVAVKSDFDNALEGLRRMRNITYRFDKDLTKLRALDLIRERVDTVMTTITGGPNINYEQWAGIACERARSTMIYKSDNKLNLTKQYEIKGVKLNPAQKLSEAESKLGVIRNEVNDKMRADDAAQEGVGNCGEQSCIAANFLLLNNIAPLVMCNLAHPGDHVFVAIGPGISRLDETYENFNVWPPGIYICDPWANIYCESEFYATKFHLKMHEWSRKGKAIRGFGRQGFFDPTGIADCVSLYKKEFWNIVR